MYRRQDASSDMLIAYSDEVALASYLTVRRKDVACYLAFDKVMYLEKTVNHLLHHLYKPAAAAAVADDDGIVVADVEKMLHIAAAVPFLAAVNYWNEMRQSLAHRQTRYEALVLEACALRKVIHWHLILHLRMEVASVFVDSVVDAEGKRRIEDGVHIGAPPTENFHDFPATVGSGETSRTRPPRHSASAVVEPCL